MRHVSWWTEQLLNILLFFLLPATVLFKAAPNLFGVGIVFLAAVNLNTQSFLDYLRNLPGTLYIFAAFLLWGICSSLWSLDPQLTSMTSLKLTLILACSLIIYHYFMQREHFQLRWLGYGFFLAVILVMSELLTDGFIYKLLSSRPYNASLYNHGITLLLLFFWPLILFNLGSRKKPLIILTPLLAFVLYLSNFHAAVLAFGFGLVAWIVCYSFPKLFMRTAAILTVLLMFGLPWAIHQYTFKELLTSTQSVLVKTSYHHRLAIMKRTTNMIAQKPILGHGVNTFPSNLDEEKIYSEDYTKLFEPEKHNITDDDLEVYGQATHPHNFILQVWYETGLVGAFLMACFLFYGLWTMPSYTNDKRSLASVAGLYTSSFILLNISFSAWQTWWLFSLMIACGLIFSLLSTSEAKDK